MALRDDFFALINHYERQIERNSFTKSDVIYHNTKQTLHNLWSKVYSLKASTEKTRLIEKIRQCLFDLERTAEKNEKTKYINYYSATKKNKELEMF